MSSSHREYTVSLPKDLAEEARSRSGESGLSAYLEEALRVRVQRERLAELAAWMQEENGPVSQEQIRQVREEMHRAHMEQGITTETRGAGFDAA